MPPNPRPLQLLRATAARWTAVNLILEAGRPGFESDTGQLKIGDGATRWALLPYVGSGLGGGGGGQFYALAGETVGEGQTSIVLENNGQQLTDGEPGIPVPSAMITSQVAVSFLADSAPAGDGTATLWRRPDGAGEFTVAATFVFSTS